MKLLEKYQSIKEHLSYSKILHFRIIMTCYFRHKQMKDVFAKAGVEVTKENRKEVDRVIHGIVGVEYKSCPNTWRKVKERLAEDETAFITVLRAGLNI